MYFFNWADTILWWRDHTKQMSSIFWYFVQKKKKQHKVTMIRLSQLRQSYEGLLKLNRNRKYWILKQQSRTADHGWSIYAVTHISSFLHRSGKPGPLVIWRIWHKIKKKCRDECFGSLTTNSLRSHSCRLYSSSLSAARALGYKSQIPILLSSYNIFFFSPDPSISHNEWSRNACWCSCCSRGCWQGVPKKLRMAKGSYCCS